MSSIVEKCAENYKSLGLTAAIVGAVFLITFIAKNKYWAKRKDLKDASLPPEFRNFFEHIPIEKPYQPIAYRTVYTAWNTFWKKVIPHHNGIEIRHLFFDSLSTLVRHGEILNFYFRLPADNQTPLSLEVELKNKKTVDLFRTNMSGAAELIIELKTKNPNANWSLEEQTTFGVRQIALD